LRFSESGVFELLVQRNGQKRDKKNRRKKTTGLVSQLFWQKVFDMDFPQKVFDGVFELPWLRNTKQGH
jgi:hypothetical protein